MITVPTVPAETLATHAPASSTPDAPTTPETFDTLPTEATPNQEVDNPNPTRERGSNEQNTTQLATQPQAAIAITTETPEEKAARELIFWEEVRLLGELRESEQLRSDLDDTLFRKTERKKQLESELHELACQIPRIQQEIDETIEETLHTARALLRLKNHSSVAAGTSLQTALPTSPEPTPALPAVATDNAPPADTTPEPPAAYRSLATLELLEGMEGLGKTKQAAICERAPTLGHLEDLIAQSKAEKVPLGKLLGKGCGEKVCTQIVDRLATRIAQLSTAGTDPASDVLANDLLKEMRERAAVSAWRPEDCELDATDPELHHQGFHAYNAGKPHTAIPTQKMELARQWMVGWVCAEVIATARSTAPTVAAGTSLQTESPTSLQSAAATKPPRKTTRKPKSKPESTDTTK